MKSVQHLANVYYCYLQFLTCAVHSSTNDVICLPGHFWTAAFFEKTQNAALYASIVTCGTVSDGLCDWAEYQRWEIRESHDWQQYSQKWQLKTLFSDCGKCSWRLWSRPKWVVEARVSLPLLNWSQAAADIESDLSCVCLSTLPNLVLGGGRGFAI